MRNEPEEFKKIPIGMGTMRAKLLNREGRFEKDYTKPHLIIGFFVLLTILITIVLIQPVEVELSGKIAGNFKGFIDLLNPQYGVPFFKDFKINDVNANIEGSVKVRVPLIVLYIIGYGGGR